MAKIKIKSKDIMLRNKEENTADLKTARERMLELRMKQGESKNKNVKETRELRKNIARILTALNGKT
ncbi:50S ribosomal protein L29 [Candidatus Giovannonibacteria bacterium RIFCSPLOWO2_01_FULL_45_34]|uniref:Large ribosomal subunit protein uL29 n=1 Tax=Candidatus Giovannonibacteria bacterium RIFCSPLOWO2_01_FULL_45_34 TaxID=1798351 RepID=A0A1F5X067_9BACT|nr:MAG: 50S ribosomal protein L29 [Candidatus Giovannonibacteria bacterium RIFCSPLOWO2_01_FULL_45_34]